MRDMQMEFNDIKGLTEYLKTVSELEASVYQQEESVRQAKNSLELNSPDHIYQMTTERLSARRANIKKPVDMSTTVPQPTAERALANFEVFFLVLAIGAFVMGLVFTEALGACFAIAAILFLPYWAITHNRKKKVEETNRSRRSYYDSQVKRLREKYEKDQVEYKQLISENDAEFEEAKRRRDLDIDKYPKAKAEISKLELPLEVSKETLQNLYDLDVIFPKYRNLIAVSTIYEYFASGRCTELTGPNGAYNLYESELRQNLIIGKLENIQSNLEQIKDNQYILYSEMSKANRSIEEINQDVRSLLTVANSSKASLDIAAKCAEATQKNTEALKYLNLINVAK